MSDFTFSLNLPQWLAQWLTFKCGGVTPIRLPKGSNESLLVQKFSSRKSETDMPDVENPDAVMIEIPENKLKPAHVYCYMSDRAKRLLTQSISEWFNFCLSQDIVRCCFPSKLKKELIEAWMEQNGIEINDTNWSGVEKRFKRLRESMLNSKRVKKHRKTVRN